MVNGGSGYTVAPTVTITPAPGDLTGKGATATAVISNGVVTAISVVNGGSGYTAPPTITLSSVNATAQATLLAGGVSTINVTNLGNGYTKAPAVVITPAYGDTTGSGATAVAVITNGQVTAINVVTSGSGYTAPPIVSIAPSHESVFELDQNPIIVPQAAYDSAYGANLPGTPAAGAYSKIYDTSLTFLPLDLTQASKMATSSVTIPFQPKAIQELFDNVTGRMQAELGVELKFTNGGNQTTIPYTLQDPVTEILDDTTNVQMTPIGVLADGTQIWKITHNGVDTHPVHVHLFNVQVINRVGWDGAIRPPDPNELGWKETVRMNPLEDVIIAMRPVSAKVPFGVPDSYHLLDPTQPKGGSMGFSNIDPAGNPYVPPSRTIIITSAGSTSGIATS